MKSRLGTGGEDSFGVLLPRHIHACFLTIASYNPHHMSEYGNSLTKHNVPAPLLSHDPLKEKKEARKKLLVEIEQSQRENYLRGRITTINSKRQINLTKNECT